MASAAQRNIRSISYAKYGYFFILPFFFGILFFPALAINQYFLFLALRAMVRKLMNLLAWATLKLCCSVLVTWDVQHRLFMKHFFRH